MDLRWAMVTSHAWTLASGRQFGVGLQCGEESLGPAVFRVVGAENRAAHSQDRGSVLPDDQLERLLGLH